MSAFPWDTVKAETLRSLARDIGIASTHKRDELVSLFRTVQHKGLDAAIEEDKELRNVALSKRKANFLQQASHRPRRSRRSDPAPVTMVTRYKGARTMSYRTVATTKPGRKSAVKKTSARVVRRFDGVVLAGRRSAKRKRQESPPAEVEGEEDEDMDADADADEGGDGDADGEVDVELQDEAAVAEEPEPSAGNSSEKENEVPASNMDGDQVNDMSIEQADEGSEDVGDYMQAITADEDSESATEGKLNGDLPAPAEIEPRDTVLAEDVPAISDSHTSNEVDLILQGQTNGVPAYDAPISSASIADLI